MQRPRVPGLETIRFNKIRKTHPVPVATSAIEKSRSFGRDAWIGFPPQIFSRKLCCQLRLAGVVSCQPKGAYQGCMSNVPIFETLGGWVSERVRTLPGRLHFVTLEEIYLLLGPRHGFLFSFLFLLISFFSFFLWIIYHAIFKTTEGDNRRGVSVSLYLFSARVHLGRATAPAGYLRV
jgi:hypothetical protein